MVGRAVLEVSLQDHIKRYNCSKESKGHMSIKRILKKGRWAVSCGTLSDGPCCLCQFQPQVPFSPLVLLGPWPLLVMWWSSTVKTGELLPQFCTGFIMKTSSWGISQHLLEEEDPSTSPWQQIIQGTTPVKLTMAGDPAPVRW